MSELLIEHRGGLRALALMEQGSLVEYLEEEPAAAPASCIVHNRACGIPFLCRIKGAVREMLRTAFLGALIGLGALHPAALGVKAPGDAPQAIQLARCFLDSLSLGTSVFMCITSASLYHAGAQLSRGIRQCSSHPPTPFPMSTTGRNSRARHSK